MTTNTEALRALDSIEQYSGSFLMSKREQLAIVRAALTASEGAEPVAMTDVEIRDVARMFATNTEYHHGRPVSIQFTPEAVTLFAHALLGDTQPRALADAHMSELKILRLRVREQRREMARLSAQQAAPDPLHRHIQEALSSAPDMLTSYVEAIKASGDYDRWHYIPEVEDVAGLIRGYVAPQPPAPSEQTALPNPGSPEASAMIDSLLAEYHCPANPKNAARAGYEAARRMLGATSEQRERAMTLSEFEAKHLAVKDESILGWHKGFCLGRQFPAPNEQRKPLNLTSEEAQKVIDEVAELIGFGPDNWDIVDPVYLVQVIARKAHGIRSTGGEHG